VNALEKEFLAINVTNNICNDCSNNKFWEELIVNILLNGILIYDVSRK
jgi:hypothetical protein